MSPATGTLFWVPLFLFFNLIALTRASSTVSNQSGDEDTLPSFWILREGQDMSHHQVQRELHMASGRARQDGDVPLYP